MSLKTLLTRVLPLLLAAPFSAHAYQLNSYFVDALSTNGNEHIFGTWDYNATSNTLVNVAISQDDFVNGKSYTYSLSSNTTQFNPAPNTFSIQSFVDDQGDFWPGFSLQTLAAITQIGIPGQQSLDFQNSLAFDFVGNLYHLEGFMLETNSVSVNIPEPTTIVLLTGVLFGLGLSRRKTQSV